MMNVGEEFSEYHKKLLGKDYDSFLDALSIRQNRWSLRINTIKSSGKDVSSLLKERNVDCAEIPWCPDGLWVSDEDLNWPEHQLGYYYVQDASSMIPSLVLDPRPGETVLDVCAAPGSKTTHIGQLMKNKGLLVANDQDYRRIRALVINLQRCGVSNCAITNLDGIGIESKLKTKFDKVLVDAPCSSIGLAQRNPWVLSDWTIEKSQKLGEIQKMMISSAYKLLKPGGTLVYSTCTTALEENEYVVEYLLENENDASIERPELVSHFRAGFSKAGNSCIRV
ncbi:MAG: RsmB/NOP family class I SAM-dependent RNA methyltransferase, partial [Candidatus Altiarchaeota archaeon]